MAPLTLVELSQFASQVMKAKEYDAHQLINLEKLAHWLLPEASLRDDRILVTIPKVAMKLLRLISNAQHADQFRCDRERLVKILSKCFIRHTEIPASDLTNLMCAFNECCDKQLMVRNLLLETCFGTFLSYGSIKHECEKAKQVLDMLNQLLLGASRELRCSLRERFPKETKALVNFLINCGDYTVQEVVLEALTRLAPRNVRESLVNVWFGDFPEEAKEAFVNFGQVQFEIEMQVFLEAVNSRFDTQVHSCLCHKLIFNGDKMYKADVQKDLIVNLSLGSKLISFAAVMKKGPVDDETNPLKSVEIKVSYVKEAAWIPTKHELLKALSFTFSCSTAKDVFVLMILQEVDDAVIKQLFGKILRHSDELLEVSQIVLDQAKSPKLGCQQDLDVTPYMPKNRPDSPWSNFNSRASSSAPSEPNPVSGSAKPMKRQATPVKKVKNLRPPRDRSPGNSTYADYMTNKDSDEDLDQELEEGKGKECIMVRKATPIPGLPLLQEDNARLASQAKATRVTATPAVLSKTKLSSAFQTPVESGRATTPAQILQSNNIKPAVQTPAVTDFYPERMSTPAPSKSTKIPDSDDEAERPALKRKATPAGKQSVPRRRLKPPSTDTEEDEMPLSLRIAAYEDDAVSKPRAQRARGRPRKATQPRKVAKPKKAPQPRTRKPRQSLKDESKYTKLEVNVVSHPSEKSPLQTFNTLQQQVNAPVKKRVADKAEFHDDMLGKRLRVAAEKGLKTYGRKPTFPKFRASDSFRSRDSVFDDLVMSVAPLACKPVHPVTPRRMQEEDKTEVAAEPHLFEDISGVEVRQSSLKVEKKSSGGRKSKATVQNVRQNSHSAPRGLANSLETNFGKDQARENRSKVEGPISTRKRETVKKLKEFEQKCLSKNEVRMEMDASDVEVVNEARNTKTEKPAEYKQKGADAKQWKKRRADVTGGYNFEGLFRQDSSSSEEEMENDCPGINFDPPVMPEEQIESSINKRQSELKEKEKPISVDALASMVRRMKWDSPDTLELEVEKKRKKTEKRLEELYTTFTRTEITQQLRVKIVKEMHSEVEKALAEEKERLQEYNDIVLLSTNIKTAFQYLLAAETSHKPNKSLAKFKELDTDLRDSMEDCADDSQIHAEGQKIVEETIVGFVPIVKAHMQNMVSKLKGVFKFASKANN